MRYTIKFKKFHEFYIIDNYTKKEYGGFDRFEVKPAEELCKQINQLNQDIEDYKEQVKKVLSDKLTRAQSLYVEATPNAPTEHNRWVDSNVISEIIQELGIEYD